MSTVEERLPSLDLTRALQLAAEARKADSAVVTADVRPNPRVGTSRDVAFVGNCNSLNAAVSRVPPTIVRRAYSTRVSYSLPPAMQHSTGVTRNI